MSDTPVKIEVSIRITEKVGYDWREIATAKIEDQAPWGDVRRGALDTVIEDATERVGRQLKAEHAKRRAAEEAAQEVDQF